jgi:hypothetical protein
VQGAEREFFDKLMSTPIHLNVSGYGIPPNLRPFEQVLTVKKIH